jgi:hypothetical protein
VEITCPSGLRGNIRSWKVRDEEIYTDQKYHRAGTVLTEICKASFVEVLDQGPYKAPLDWDKVLAGDRLYIIMQARILSYGPHYDFRTQCDNSSCKEAIEWSLNLNDLDVTPLDPESRRKVREDAPFVTLCDGKTVKYRLLRGEDDRFAATYKGKSVADNVNTRFVRRILEVEGVVKDPIKIKEWLKNLDGAVGDQLRDELESVDCGYNTQFEIVCQACGFQQMVILPLGATFFSNRKMFRQGRETVQEKNSDG